MFTDILEKADKGKRIVTAVEAEGSCPGYRCIAVDGEIVYESPSDNGEAVSWIKEEILKADATCYKEAEEEKVFFEVLSKAPRLVICGGGHVSLAIVKMAKLLKLPVTVIEDRPMFANQIREAQADEVICDSFEHGLAGIESDSDTYFVIVTRGHRYDRACLETILKKRYAYVGMMGSRSRVLLLKKNMRDEGWAPEKLDDLHAPIGVDIHSETPEEIAVSILGEIISVKNSQKRSEGFTEEVCEGLKSPGRKALATIVMRKGSAPRQIGTKVVIFEDGTAKGTIGGGCAEAELMRTARQMLMSGETTPKLVRVNMTNREAEDEGMVCGGIQDVFLEIVE